MRRLLAAGLASATLLLLPASTAAWNSTEVVVPVPMTGKHAEAYYDQYHDLGYYGGKKGDIEGCPAPFRVVPNLMGNAATKCAECLTKLHGRYSCKDECDALARGSEFFVPPRFRDLVTTCESGDACERSSSSTEACQCCGLNLGMGYNMPQASAVVAGIHDPLFKRWGELANFKRTCDYPVSANNCQACLLWRKIRGDYFQGPLTSLQSTQGDRCYQTKDKKHTFLGTFVYDPAHYLLMPGSKTADWPVLGIEDKQVLTHKLEDIWDLAWRLAYKPYQELPFVPFGSVSDLPVSDTSCNIGLALNPASARSQHQLHIHIARIPTTLRRLFVGRKDNFGTWTKVCIPITRKPDEHEWPTVYVRYFSLVGHNHKDKYDGDASGSNGGYDDNGGASGRGNRGYGNDRDYDDADTFGGRIRDYGDDDNGGASGRGDRGYGDHRDYDEGDAFGGRNHGYVDDRDYDNGDAFGRNGGVLGRDRGYGRGRNYDYGNGNSFGSNNYNSYNNGYDQQYAGPSEYGIFHQAFSFAKFDSLYLQAWGILIIPDEEPIDLRKKDAKLPRGFYLVLSTNNAIGSWNPYQGTKMQNENFEPELLLCTSYSAGNGGFWTKEECYGEANKAVQYAAKNGASKRFEEFLADQQLAQIAQGAGYH